MQLKETLSDPDGSQNFIFHGDFPGYFEARYVRRQPHYFTCYLSSQAGCAQRCRQCWLTATGQVYAKDADLDVYTRQACEVLRYYEAACSPARVVHFSWQARGEVLANALFTADANRVLQGLGKLAAYYKLLPKFCLSTILPQTFAQKELTDTFPIIHPTIYYSIYSVNPAFRKKWLPKALPVDVAMGKLKRYQEHTGKAIRLHWALIEGENDSYGAVQDIIDCVQDNALRVDVNLVRYNPYSEVYGKEPSELVIQARASQLRDGLPFPSRVKVVSRVGRTVYASCGQFFPPKDLPLVSS